MTARKTNDGKPFKVGDGTPGPGRPKGVPNKATMALKDMILQALDKQGGADYLYRQADENPTAFMTLIGKVLPMQVIGDPANPLHHSVRLDMGRFSEATLREIAAQSAEP